ncbi:MAG: protein kinase [Planctomycetaceae bacterium]|nr:protein kinase [Planctomycetaceae bacterium]
MPAPNTGREFLDLLTASQLVEAEFLQELRTKLQRHEGADPKRLAKTLIKNNILTEYHAKQLLAGRYKGFYIGKYKILDQIGQGGMGRVFLAEQITMERLVAVKVVSRIKRKDREQEILARFAREAKAVAALRHNNIIHAYDFDQENGVPYIVMEFVEGIDTALLAGKCGPIPWAQAADYIRQAASGLQHAHEAGMVHRDIKPGNLLLDVSGTIKILDLGLCSALEGSSDDSLTVDQNQLGTVDFIAPEQAVDSHNVDARADIYSLGATFYGLLSGQILYPDKTAAQKLLLHQTTDPRPIRELVPKLPEELAAVVHKMLAKQRDDRHQTAAEVVAALQPFAQPQQPAYDPKLLKVRRATFEPYMGNAPAPGDISIQTLKAPSDTAKSSSDSGTAVTQTSQIALNDSLGGLEQFSYGDDYTDLALPKPKSKKSGKSKRRRKKGKSDNTFLLSAGTVLGLLLVVLLAVTFWPDATESKEEQKPKIPVRASNQVGPATYSEWQTLSDALRDDPGVRAYYAFRGGDLDGTKVKNVSTTGELGPLLVDHVPWGDGRWPQKGGLEFHGIASGEYAAFSAEDSTQLNLRQPITIALWIKIHKFEVPWQAILSKGDFTWRLQRYNASNHVAFAINPAGPAGKAAQSHDKTVFVQSKSTLEDRQWHHLVVTIKKGTGNQARVELYVDGELEGTTLCGFPGTNKDPVWLGANPDSKMRERTEEGQISQGTRTLDGQIDELVIWKRPLNQHEIKRLYRQGRPS